MALTRLVNDSGWFVLLVTAVYILFFLHSYEYETFDVFAYL